MTDDNEWWHKSIVTYFSDMIDGQYAVIKHNLKEEYLYIEYYDENDNMFSKEDFIGKSIRYVEDAAENWALGIKKI